MIRNYIQYYFVSWYDSDICSRGIAPNLTYNDAIKLISKLKNSGDKYAFIEYHPQVSYINFGGVV